MPVVTNSCRFVVAVLLGMALLPSVARSQEATTRHPLEPSDTSSPAATLKSLIDACNELHDLIDSGAVADKQTRVLWPTGERIVDCLDLSELPTELRETAGVESALFLKEVLDRIDLPNNEDIPGGVDSEANGERPLRWRIPGTRIVISRSQPGSQSDAYLFTSETVRRAAEFYRMAKHLPYRTEGRSVSSGLYDAYAAMTITTQGQSSDTSSPRGTLKLFLDSCDEIYEKVRTQKHVQREDPDVQRAAQRAISCLDISQLPDYSREYFGAEAAVCLKEVIDRTTLPQPEEVPGIESVESSDGVETLVRWQIPRTRLVISKIEEGPRRGEFLFSAETVVRAPEFYQKALA